MLLSGMHALAKRQRNKITQGVSRKREKALLSESVLEEVSRRDRDPRSWMSRTPRP